MYGDIWKREIITSKRNKKLIMTMANGKNGKCFVKRMNEDDENMVMVIARCR